MIYEVNASGTHGVVEIETLNYRTITGHCKCRVSTSGSRFSMDVLWDII
jgi:hypothetical protein